MATSSSDVSSLLTMEEIAVLWSTVDHLTPNYLDGAQPHGCLQCSQRVQVVEFIVEMSEDYGCSLESAWLAVRIFDRYVDSVISRGSTVPQSCVESIACVCFVIGSKFLEVRQPSLADVAREINCKCEGLKQLETIILNELDWHVYTFTPHALVSLVLPCSAEGAEAVQQQTRQLALEMVDASMFYYPILEFTTATVAAAACTIAARKLSNGALASMISQIIEKCSIEKVDACMLSLLSRCHSLAPAPALPVDCEKSSEKIHGGTARRSESPSSIMEQTFIDRGSNNSICCKRPACEDLRPYKAAMHFLTSEANTERSEPVAMGR
ncbi:hypothetical protein AB1Y20_019364 [Prymnesium parvum]|uniref:Cyclin-like domain-containing protein n=1 Tax=Prymnesium parvum TaxID=97485 RepID=A0AB34JUS8_PRYPA